MTGLGPLGPREREALVLAHEIRLEMRAWMEHRGVAGAPVVSPFVDSAGQPNVLIRMNAYLARAMLLSFAEVRTAPPQPRRDNGLFSGDA